jgi:hypothetical protein
MVDDDPVEGAMAVTGAFLDTFNAGDAAAHATTLSYPHVRLASGRVRLDDPASGLPSGWKSTT